MLDLTPVVIWILKAENLAPTLKGGFSNLELRSDPLKYPEFVMVYISIETLVHFWIETYRWGNTQSV
jgi:hypothetical protein